MRRREGRLGEAIGHFRAALRVNPDDATVRSNLAAALAVLAAARADVRQFPEAITAAQEALTLAKAAGQTAMAQSIEAHLGCTARASGRVSREWGAWDIGERMRTAHAGRLTLGDGSFRIEWIR